MKVTIENGEETKVWEDVALFAGAIVLSETTDAVIFVDAGMDIADRILNHIYAARAMCSLLKEKRFKIVNVLRDVAEFQETEENNG